MIFYIVGDVQFIGFCFVSTTLGQEKEKGFFRANTLLDLADSSSKLRKNIILHLISALNQVLMFLGE